jgi:Protein of unknown function (DUF1579)
MKKLTNLLLFSSLCLVCISARSQSQDDMKSMMAYMTPGDLHKMMAKSVGDWTGAITMWSAPGAQPMSMTGESHNEMILGGRYLQGKSKGNMMGMPFEGISVTGYDNAKKVFVNSWIDNMGTGMIFLEGQWDSKSNSIEFKGMMVDPSSGKDLAVREVMKIIDDNTQTMEMYTMAGGKEFKSMEIKYVKK